MKKDNSNLFLFLAVAVIIIAGGVAIALLSTQEPDRRLSTDKTLVENISENAELTKFAELVEKAGFTETLSGEEEYTVFAPSNTAFADVQKKIDKLLAEDNDKNSKELLKIMSRHIVKGKFEEADLRKDSLTELETIDGQTLKIKLEDIGTKENPFEVLSINKAAIVTADGLNNNGTLHIVGAVL